jgi:CubicO group peptidase (beta-lactamase class C family)
MRAFPAASPESQGIPTAAVRKLADEVAEYVKAGTIVGGELLVIENRKTILHEAFGDRDREDKLPMARDTLFNIRSMTKPLTGVAIQMLVEGDKLRLADPVAKYLPGFNNDKSRAAVWPTGSGRSGPGTTSYGCRSRTRPCGRRSAGSSTSWPPASRRPGWPWRTRRRGW